MTLLGCALLGGICFVWLGPWLREKVPLLQAAIWQQLGFAIALGLIFVVIVIWQRARGETLRQLGWGAPTTVRAVLAALLLGGLYLWGSAFGAHHLLPGVDVASLDWFRLALAPVGIFMAIAEETMMRGFFMTELQRARISTAVQIVASGACSAVYHAMHNPTLAGFLPSFVLFTLHAALFVYGKRSLTPPVIAHSIYHVFGEPYLLMMVLQVGTLPHP